MILSSIIRIVLAVSLAIITGKLIAKFRLPAILGWLIAGMLLGPHALGLINSELLDASWYNMILNILETCLGIMIGLELVFRKLKKSGKQIIITTLSQSLGTFLIVTICFGIIFYISNIPLYLAVIFGGIALATAPAPALSIVREFKTQGPVTRTLIPMAALDDIIGITIFFIVTTVITATQTEQSSSLIVTLAIMILLPIIVGIGVGFIGGIFLKKECPTRKTSIISILLILVGSSLGLVFNNFILDQPVFNFMLMGMAFSSTFSNMVSEERLINISIGLKPIIGFSLIIVILNLGVPLDYKLIIGAGSYTAIYISSRAVGKCTGAFLGARISGLPTTVQKYLGLTLLPHSGVSLVFTGIAVSSLNTFDPASAVIIQGTISAAAIINEVIAVIASKKSFEWAGEYRVN